MTSASSFLQPVVFFLQLLQPLRLVWVQTAVFLFPPVIDRLADPFVPVAVCNAFSLPFIISMSQSSHTISSALYVFRDIFIIPLSYITTAFLYKQLAPFPGSRSLFHSDRGCQYSSMGFRQMLEQHGITSSMGRPDCPYDNSCNEKSYAPNRYVLLLPLKLGIKIARLLLIEKE